MKGAKMSVLIKGMKMPKEGMSVVVDLWNNGKAYVYGTGSSEMYDAVELPEHGNLVDRDEFIGRQQSWALLIAMGHGNDDEWVKCIGEVCDHLYDAPVVIPAERNKGGAKNESY